MNFINPSEAIKRLAAAQGIDVLNLVKTEQQLAQEQQAQQQQAAQQSLVDQAGQLASAPMLDPSKNQPPQDGQNQTQPAGQGQAQAAPKGK